LVKKDKERFTQPTFAFITFEDEYGYTKAIQAGKTKDKNSPFKFNQAPDPTDIIWENRHRSPLQIHLRELVAYIVIFAVLMLSFWGLFALSREAVEIAAIFPP